MFHGSTVLVDANICFHDLLCPIPFFLPRVNVMNYQMPSTRGDFYKQLEDGGPDAPEDQDDPEPAIVDTDLIHDHDEDGWHCRVAGQVRQVGPFLAGSWFVKPSNSMYIYTYVYCQHQVIWLGSVWLKMNKCPAAEPSLLWWAMTLSDFSSAQGITHGPVTNQGSAFNCPRVNQAWQ